MSEYRYSVLGHWCASPDGSTVVFYWSANNSEWMVRDNGRLLYADQYRLVLEREDAILDDHLKEAI